MVTKMATTFFEFQFDIAIPRGAPQHSAASNGGGNVGQSRGGGVLCQKNQKPKAFWFYTGMG